MDEVEYPIMGKYQNGETEQVDSAESREEASRLLSEYILAFGAGWRLWIGKRRRCHAPA